MGFFWGGRPWWRGARFFEGGEIRIAILSLLSEGEKNGYQLMKELKDRSGGMYRASAGSMYPTLQMLEDEGLIAADSKDGRRLYHLTDAGRAELARDPETVKRIWERAETWEDWARWYGPPVMSFKTQLQVLLKATMRAAKWADGLPERDTKLRETLQRMAKEMEDLVKEPGAV
jgi:DNA-binding PadR family transcriptional regulator